MTTMVAAAARRRHPRAVLAVVMGLASLGVAGCETSGSVFGSNSFGSQEPLATTQATSQQALAKVSLAALIGAPDNVSKQIQQEFTTAAEQQRVTVITNRSERADYTLRGYIVAAKDKNATRVTYIWDVNDPNGKHLNRFQGEEVINGNSSKDPWAAVSPAVAQTLGTKAATSFATWLSSQGGQPVASSGATQPAGANPPVAAASSSAAERRPAARPPAKQATAAAAAAGPTTGSIARDGAITALVPSVTGAPGDGSQSLTAAIQRELSGKGITVIDKPTNAAYRVEGSVKIGQAREGKQPIQIEWLVRDPQGKKVGTVSQKNEIPEGSLNGSWGRTAEQAAGAAAQGIIKLLQPQTAVN